MRRVVLSAAVVFSAGASIWVTGCATSREVGDREADRLVQQLSWASVDGGIGWLTVSWDGPAAERLMQIGTPAAPALLRALEDPQRAVAAHIILTSLLHRERVGAKQRWIYREPRRYHTAADLLGVAVTVNGLEWTVFFDPIRYYVAPEDLRENARRWRREITGTT